MFISGKHTSDPVDQPFYFAGCLYDTDTKLCHFGAREYDPSTGRWLSKDPLLFGGGDTNLYGYVVQDPVNRVDAAGTGPVLSSACQFAVTNVSVDYQRQINALRSQALSNIQSQISTDGDQILRLLNLQCVKDKTAVNNEIAQLNAQIQALQNLMTQINAYSLVGTLANGAGSNAGYAFCNLLNGVPGA